MDTAIDTTNDFFMSGGPSGLAPIMPVKIKTQEQAMRTAAWILAMGELLPWEGEPVTFDEVRKAIGNT